MIKYILSFIAGFVVIAAAFWLFGIDFTVLGKESVVAALYSLLGGTLIHLARTCL